MYTHFLFLGAPHPMTYPCGSIKTLSPYLLKVSTEGSSTFRVPRGQMKLSGDFVSAQDYADHPSYSSSSKSTLHRPLSLRPLPREKKQPSGPTGSLSCDIPHTCQLSLYSVSTHHASQWAPLLSAEGWLHSALLSHAKDPSRSFIICE